MSVKQIGILLGNLVSIVLAVFSIIGLVYLTRFAFSSSTVANGMAGLQGPVSCVGGIDQSKLRFAKFTVVILWIQIVLSIMVAIFSMLSTQML